MIFVDAEKRILQFMAEKHLARKEDIIKMLDGAENATMEACSFPCTRHIVSCENAVNAACESLVDQGYLSPVSIIGPTCYAITQKGMRTSRG